MSAPLQHMNHVAAVAAPLIGGLVWMHFGYQIIFFTGAFIALVSLIVSQWIDPDQPQLEKEGRLALSPAAG